jgi:hypothetical protein
LTTLFSNTLNLCSSLNVRDQVSHPHKHQVQLQFCIFEPFSVECRYLTDTLKMIPQSYVDKFFFAFLWSFVYHMSLLTAAAMARHYWTLYQVSAAIWRT